MTLKELIEAAKKAVGEGNLELARTYKAQAEALKEIEALEPVATIDTDEVKALRDFKARVEAEPVKKAATLVVTEDETDKKAAMPWRSFGEQLKAVYTAAAQPFKIDERLKAQKAILGANEQQGSEGGFLVQTDFAQDLMMIMHEQSTVASRCRRIPIGANANGLKINAVDETNRSTGRWGGIQGYWVAEGGSITASQPKFRQMSMELHKLAAAVYATDELLADATALGAVVQQAASEEMSFMLGDSIFNGNGAGKPFGVLGSGALVSVAKEAGQPAATLQYENILKMWSRMWAPSRANAVWFINQDIEPQLLGMDFPVGTGGVPVFLPPGGLSQSPYGTLMGRPVIPTEFNQTLGTVGDIVFADLSQYLLIDKGGVQQASSMHVQFLTDQMVFRFTYRVDGQSTWYKALTPAKGSATLSPFVALATRS